MAYNRIGGIGGIEEAVAVIRWDSRIIGCAG